LNDNEFFIQESKSNELSLEILRLKQTIILLEEKLKEKDLLS
jgi:hypothetical protein